MYNDSETEATTLDYHFQLDTQLDLQSKMTHQISDPCDTVRNQGETCGLVRHSHVKSNLSSKRRVNVVTHDRNLRLVAAFPY